MVDLLYVLAAAAGVSLVFGRLRLAPIPGYLIAGAVFGPNAFGLVQDSASIDGISHVAIILLMFGIGLHLDRTEFRTGVKQIIGVGVLSTLVSIGLGIPVAMAFGLHAPGAVAVSSAMAMSSTAVVLRILQQRRELRLAPGRLAFGILLMQDLAVVAIIAFMPVLAAWAGPGDEDLAGPSVGLGSMIGAALTMVGAIGLLIALGMTLLPRVLHEAARDGSSELLLVCSAAFALAAAVVTGWLGLSPELGAFLAGFLLAGTPFRHQLSGQIGPMRDLFMAVFFTAVGLSLDISIALEVWWVILVGAAAVMAIKIISIGGSAWMFKIRPTIAGAAAISLAQAGEFSLVVAGVAEAEGLFVEEAAKVQAVIVGIVFVSLLLTPNMIAGANPMGAKLAGLLFRLKGSSNAVDPENAAQDEQDDRRRVIVVGYGPVGRAVTHRLDQTDCDITIIEMNPETVRRQAGLGRKIVYGDVTNTDVLESAGARRAHAIILTMPDDDATFRACRVIRTINGSVFIAARTNFLSKAFLAREHGADHVTVEELATAEHMASQVLEAIQKRPYERRA